MTSGARRGDGELAAAVAAATGLRPGRLRGYIRRPTQDQLIELGAQEFLHLSTEEAGLYAQAVDGYLSLFDRLDELAPPTVELRHRTRDPGRAPSPEEDPFNEFIWLCDVRGASDGPLAGRRVALKDNLAVAGVPTTNGSRIAASVPTHDAVVVERILDAGARIVGKLNMDDFGTAGTGEHSAFGPTRNPLDPRHSAGGSSCGAGAVVASNHADLALAVDQGGSARIPASFCGVVALKASHGLIPSHGVTHIDHTLDHICPVARSVAEVATATDVLSGYDWRDPQCSRSAADPTSCTDGLGNGVAGMRIGIIEQAFEGCEPEVVDGLERARAIFVEAGAEVVPISIPIWQDGWPIEAAILCQLGWAMVQSEGVGFGHLGLVDAERAQSFALARRLQADDFPPALKIWLLVGRYIHEHYPGVYLAKAKNLRLLLRRQVDAALRECDLLMTPTTPYAAPRLAEGPVNEVELTLTASTMAANVAPLNLSGHPALAVPSGATADGLPVSVQIVGGLFDDARVLRAGAVVEAARGSS